MARSMAAMQQMLNSMTPEQRAQLQGLAQALLEDMDLRWQVDELSRNLQQAFPDMPWNQRMNFRGDDPLQFGQMAGLLETLGDLDQLENMLRTRPSPGSSPRSTSTRPATCSARTRPARSNGSRSWRRSSRKPGSSTSARAGTSSPRRGSGRWGSRRSATCSAR